MQVTDLFRGLGPVAVFSAKHHWTAPRTIQLRKKEVREQGQEKEARDKEKDVRGILKKVREKKKVVREQGKEKERNKKAGGRSRRQP